MDPAQAAVRDLEAVETRNGAVRRTVRKRGVGKDLAAQTAGSRSRSVAAGEQPGTADCAAQCLLRLARDSGLTVHGR